MQGTLPDNLAQQLILSMFPAPLRVIGCLDNGTPVASPATDPQLLAETRDHTWFQFNTGGGMQDADPLISGAKIGDSFASPATTFAQIPDAQRATTTIQLNAEITSTAASLFGLGGGPPQGTPVLTQTFYDAELVGHPLTVGNLVSSTSIGAIFSAITNTYSPYIQLGDLASDPSQDTLIHGQDYQEVLTNFPFGSQILTGLFLNVTTTNPQEGGPSTSSMVTKTLFDRIGFAVRQGGTGSSLSVNPGTGPALTDQDIVTLDISPSAPPEAALNARENALNRDAAALSAQVPASATTIDPSNQTALALARQVNVEQTSLIGATFAAADDGVLRQQSSDLLAHSYFDTPRIVAVSSSPESPTSVLSIDILQNLPRSYAAPGQSAQTVPVLRFLTGIADSFAEESILSLGGQSATMTTTGAMDVFLQALAVPGASLKQIDANSIGNLAALNISDEAKARITASVQAGKTVLVPTTTAPLNGAPHSAWVEFDPTTGNAIAVLDNGTHIGEDFSVRQVGPSITAQQAQGLIRLQNLIKQYNSSGLGKARLLPQIRQLLQQLKGQEAVAAKVMAGFVSISAQLVELSNQVGAGTQGVDPPVGAVLYAPPTASPQFATLGTSGQTNLAAAIIPDPLFTVPVGGAQIPTVFRIGIKNLESTTDTFTLTPTITQGTGFTADTSLPQITIPAGQTAEIGICVDPTTGQIPALGSSVSFDVKVTSTTNPTTITTSASESFTVPGIDAVTIAASPSAVSTTTSAGVADTITLADVGNLPETVTLAATPPTGVTAAGLGSSVSLVPGQSQTVMVTLTPDGTVPLNSALNIPITATFGPSAAPQTATANIGLTVRSAQVVAVQQAASAAGNTQIGGTLSNLADALAQLQASPSDPAQLQHVQLELNNLNTLIQADPTLAKQTPSLVAALQPLITDANPGSNVSTLLSAVPAFFKQLTPLLTQEADQQFTMTLSPTLADLQTSPDGVQPGQSKTFTLQLTSQSPDPISLTLSTNTLPANVSADLGGMTQVKLLPGQTLNVPITLNQTLVSSQIFTLAVTAAASLVSHSASAEVAVRPASADVLGVTLSPSSVNSGTPVSLSAQVFNTANAARSLLAHIDLLDQNGNPVTSLSLPDVPVPLAPSADPVTVNLGLLPTTGLAAGLYTVQVGLRTTDGVPLPGRSASTTLLIGVPVTATISTTPTQLPPGSPSVTTTISVQSSALVAAPPSQTPSLGDIQAFYNSANTFGLGALNGPVFVIENTSTADITNGVFTITPVSGQGTPDSFQVGTIPAGGRVIVEPGVSNDGQPASSHTFFKATGTILDTANLGPNDDNTKFEFTGMVGTTTVDTGIFTPGVTRTAETGNPNVTTTFLGKTSTAGPDVFSPQSVAKIFGAGSTGGGGSSSLPPGISVSVGYADNLRPSPFFPVPWDGSPNTVFVGSGPSYDTGAILITNNTSSPVTIDDVKVTLAFGQVFDLWGSNVVPAGGNLILAQTTSYNFDTSDFGVLNYPNTYPDGETAHAAHIDITINGAAQPTLLDTGHVLTTGGSDLAAAGNESLNWRPVGTSGVGNPGGASSALTITHTLSTSGFTVGTTSPTANSTTATQIVWNSSSSGQFQLTGTVDNLAPGEVRQISQGTSVAVTFMATTGQTLTDTINLPPVVVAGEHIISLTPPAQTADRGATVTYDVALTNPSTTDPATYALSLNGLDDFTTSLDTSVTVGPARPSTRPSP